MALNKEVFEARMKALKERFPGVELIEKEIEPGVIAGVVALPDDVDEEAVKEFLTTDMQEAGVAACDCMNCRARRAGGSVN